MKNRFFFVFIVTICCISILLTSCKLTISSFTAPSTANTGEVIILTIDGSADSSGGECGLILQIPADWEIISDAQSLSERPQYASLYAAQSGYKIWVGTKDTSSGTSGQSVSETVRILTGRTPTGSTGTVQTYTLKIATGAFRNGAWVTDDPENMYDFSQITDDKYLRNISITTSAADSLSPAPVSQLSVNDNHHTGTEVTLSWSGYDETAQKDVVKYRIYQSTASFTNVSGMAYIGETPAGKFSYDVSSLTPGITYYFAVTAIDEVSNENKTVNPVSIIPPKDSYTMTLVFGSAGTGNGQFSGPTGIAIDSSGDIYVADLVNNRIQKFSSSGTYLSQFGSTGTGNAQFKNPSSIAIDSSGNIWVTDRINNRIQKFSSSRTYLSQFGSAGTGNGQFNTPNGIAVDGSGNIYVADFLNDRIQKFSSSGNYLSQFGSAGSGNGQFNHPYGIAFDNSGNIWVTDYYNHRIQKFSSSGAYLTQFGSYGTGNGQFNHPAGIAIDNSDNIWVADVTNHRVQKFNSSGIYLSQFGSYGTGNGQFDAPECLAIDSSGNIFVTEYFNARVQKFAYATRIISLTGDMAFGNIGLGLTATKVLTIANTGNSVMTVSSIAYPTGFTGNWSGGTIAAGASQNVNVTFAPTAVQAYGGTITVSSDKTGGTNTISVSGAGIDSTGYMISGTVYQSGGIYSGQGPPISGVTMTLSNGTTATTDSSGNYTFSNITAGSSVTLTPSLSGCTFTPSSQTFSNIAGNQTQNFTGTCGGTVTRIISLTGDMAFGNIGVGLTATKILTIANTGNSVMTVSAITYPTGFTGNWSGGTIAAGASQNVTVTFAPTSVQSYGGTITVSSDKTGGTNTISVSGAGISTGYTISGYVCQPSGIFSGCTAISGVTMSLTNGTSTTTDISGYYSFSNIAAGSSGTVTPSKRGYTFSPTSLSFSNVTANQTKNFTGLPITYTVTFTAGSGGTITGTASQTVKYGDNTTAVTPKPNTGYQFVSWSTAGTGGYTAVTTNPLVIANVTSNMTLTANFRQIPDTITRTISLSGSLDFGDVNVGSSKPLTLTIANTGKLPLTVSSIAYPKGFSGNWSGTIAAGSSKAVTVTFAPTALQTYSGTVRVNSDKTSGTNTMAVSGKGVPVPISYTVSGYVKYPNNTPMSGVTLTFGNNGGTATTSSTGYYSKNFSSAWTGTVTPSKSGYGANPISRSYSNITTNQTNQNFTLSGIVPTNAFRIWIDKNGNGVYDSGEGVSGASVRVNNETSDRGTTDSQGIIQLQNISNDAKIYAQKLFYSASNPKAVDANFANTRSKNPYYAGSVNGKMYDFVMASDIMAADGTYYDFPGQGKTLSNAAKDSQGNMLIRLVHPKIGWNLVVTFEEAQSSAFYDQIKAGFKSYADYMYNFTDGYFTVKNVVLVKGAYINSAQWNYSDVQVRNEEWPNASVFGNRNNRTTRISMGKVWSGDQPDGYDWYSALGHESGHYLLGFLDEYVNGNYTKGTNENRSWPYRTSHDGDPGEPNEFPDNYGLMQSQYSGVHEMSDVTDYYPRTYALSMDPDTVTGQFTRTLTDCGKDSSGNLICGYEPPAYKGKSCWSFFEMYYENDIKTQMAGQGFSDAFFSNLIIPPHTSGSYPNSDRTKRNGPTAMNRDSVNFVEWTLPGASQRDNMSDDVFDAIAIVADETGNPVAGADVWLNSSDRKSFQGKSDINGIVKCGSLLIGKGLEAYSGDRKAEIIINEVREVYVLTLPANRTDKRDGASGMIVSAKPDSSNSKHLTITASGSSLSSAPLVTLSQSDGYSVNVTMNSAGANQYSGVADCQYDSGIFEVSSGTTQSVSPFEIFTTEVGPASGYYAPNGELEMAYSPTSFTGTGSFVILNSSMPAPANNGLIQVGSVYSFGFADTVTAVNNVILTIRLPSGINTSQMNLYGWNLQNKTWTLIPGGQSDPKYFSISIASLDYAAYALFTASLANSFVPPDPITGLAASAGSSSSGITLQWTEPISALAVSAYDIRFNTVPVTDDNWNESRSLGNIPKPVAAGTVQSFTTEMPDPGIVYYFGIKAIDVAGNESSLTLSFPAKSQATDADGDGIPDIWETARGLDPNISDAQNDDDGDSMTNLQEYQYYTDPENSDTDGDGYSDGDEIDQGTDPNDYADYNDSPISPSCDKPDLVLKWGTMGTGDGQFKQPRGVATDASGNIYVADTDNNRIQKFGSTGNFIAKWGSVGTGNAQFARPYGITVDSSGNIYVADTDNNRIQKLNSTGNYITSWGSFGIANGQFSSPSSIAADSSGNIYVADTYNNRIQKFTAEGVFIGKWGGLGTGDAQFNTPFGITADSSGHIWVADTANNRIQKFDSSGNFIGKWGSFGTGNGLFKAPTGISADASGSIYVTDKDNNRIQKFTNTGTYVSVWGGYGSAVGLFIQPWGIAADRSGNIYAADRANDRIQKFACPQIQTGISATRSFPCYVAGTKLTVSVTVQPSSNTALYAVEDKQPSGWTVSNISNNGSYDPTNGKIKFGPFFDNLNRTLTYDVTPPITENGDKNFIGVVSVNGANSDITGDFVISRCASSNHPADISPKDFAMNMGEVTAYGLAWKNGTTWTVPPNPIPISYVTRAGALWQGGESYKFDSTAGESPMCWVNTSASRSVRDSEAFAVRQIAESYQTGNEISITIDISPSSDVRAYAVEDQPPAGWEVISADNNGQFDSANHKVRFGMFLDNQPRTFSYRVRASSADVSDFSGIASFNGKNIPILSKRELCDNDPNLQDVIVVLQILSGITPAEVCLAERDVNNDQKLGPEDVIYLLQIIARLR